MTRSDFVGFQAGTLRNATAEGVDCRNPGGNPTKSSTWFVAFRRVPAWKRYVGELVERVAFPRSVPGPPL